MEHMLYIGTARQRVAEVLFKYPDKEFSMSDLAKEARVKKSNMGLILAEFQQNGFVEITKLSKIWRIKANQRNPHFIKNKIIYNLASIHCIGLVEFLDDHYHHPKAIILFGSYRKGDDVSSSDIDIAIEMDEIIKYKKIDLKNFEKMIGRKIQIHLFNRKNVNHNVFNNIANGIVLEGFLEVKP